MRERERGEVDRSAGGLVTGNGLAELVAAPLGNLGGADRADPDRAADVEALVVGPAILTLADPDRPIGERTPQTGSDSMTGESLSGRALELEATDAGNRRIADLTRGRVKRGECVQHRRDADFVSSTKGAPGDSPFGAPVGARCGANPRIYLVLEAARSKHLRQPVAAASGRGGRVVRGSRRGRALDRRRSSGQESRGNERQRCARRSDW